MASVRELPSRAVHWRQRACDRFAAASRLPSLIARAALVALAALTSPVASDGSLIFFQWGNLTDILRQVALIGMIALGMTYVILTGGIDLSVGSILALATVLVATALT